MKKNILLLLIILISINANSADVLFFNQDCNIDQAGADNSCGDERYNLLNILSDQGHNITLLSDFHQEDMADLLAANDIFIIPDLEDNFIECDISDTSFISSSEKLILNNYVSSGGRLLISGSAQNTQFLNDLFGLGLTVSSPVSTGVSTLNEEQSQGTPFENCPTTISNLSVTFLVNSSMPSGKKCIYESGGSSSLAYFPVGDGAVTYIGYDFNDGGPGCSADGDIWTSCSIANSIEAAEESSNPIPTLGQWGLIILSLVLIVFGVNYIKQADSHGVVQL